SPGERSVDALPADIVITLHRLRAPAGMAELAAVWDAPRKSPRAPSSRRRVVAWRLHRAGTRRWPTASGWLYRGYCAVDRHWHCRSTAGCLPDLVRRVVLRFERYADHQCRWQC